LTKHTVTSLATGDQALLQTDLVDTLVSQDQALQPMEQYHTHTTDNLATAFPEYQGEFLMQHKTM
jgi:hypothetical protein